MKTELEKLRRTVESFIYFMNRLPEEHLAPADWGPREVLVHLVFWHETYVSTIEALIAGRTPDLPEGTFAELNAQAVRQNAEVPIARLLERFRKAQSRLEELAILDPSRSWTIPAKAGSKARPLDELIKRIEAHIRNHEIKLRRQFGRKA